MTQQQITITEQAQAPAIHPIPMDFEEGQSVTLLRGAKIGGLVTKCNQPGKVVHITYSNEFGRFTYTVAFGTMQRMYAYVGADGIEAVAEAPVEVTPLLEDATEFIERGDLVRWDFAACAEVREGVIVKIRPNLSYAMVEFEFGVLRWIPLNEMVLVQKGAARGRQTLQTEVQSVS